MFKREKTKARYVVKDITFSQVMKKFIAWLTGKDLAYEDIPMEEIGAVIARKERERLLRAIRGIGLSLKFRQLTDGDQDIYDEAINSVEETIKNIEVIENDYGVNSGDTSHLTASEACKISSCCEAEIDEWPSGTTGFRIPKKRCESCGEPCEAVSEELKWQPGQKHKQALELNDYINDTKPDPLCPGFTKEELISRVNYLLQQHE